MSLHRPAPESTRSNAYFTTEYLHQMGTELWIPRGFASLQDFATQEPTKAFTETLTHYGTFTAAAMRRLVAEQEQQKTWELRKRLMNLYYDFCDLTAPGTPSEVTVSAFDGDLGDIANTSVVAAFYFESPTRVVEQ